MKAIKRWTVPMALASVMLGVNACNTGAPASDQAAPDTPEDAAADAPVETAGRLALVIESATTAPDGRRCLLAVQVRNDTGHDALNVQAAWMARTEGFGSISDYQVLGDFAAGEARSVQLGIFGAPCDAVREVALSRAVCSMAAPEGAPASCADLVVLDDRGLVPGR